jgi:uncharacterized membrane protein
MSKKDFEGKSYIWAFPFCGAVIILSAFFYALNPFFGKVVLTFAFFVPFFIQVLTGYSLSSYWKLQYSRKTHPKNYFAVLIINLILPMWVWFII